MNEISGQTSSPTFDEIAERFVEELRAGKLPSLAEYKKAWPHLAEEIDELFPMLQELEVHQESSSTPNKTLDVSGIPDKLGEYEIVREIGRGGMGVVYEARHDIMQRRVALKVLPRSFGERKHFLERFIREARSAGKLHHTNIVPVFEVGDADGTYYYAMQYIHGQNLDVVIDELRRISRSDQRQSSLSAATDQASVAMTLWRGSTKMAEANDPGVNSNTIELGVEEEHGKGWAQLPSEKQVGESSEWSQVGDSGDSYFRRAARVGIQCAEALDFAHEHGLLHRDIKPSNLILDTNGVVWITDFGLAKVDGDNLTHTGDIVGTLRYMAPERFQGKADRRSDIYSLGLTLYELCTLEYAFDAADRAALIQQVMNHPPVSLRRIRPEIPRDLETVIVKAMAREPQARYETAGQMAADLRRYVAGKPVLARRASIPERVWRWSKRHPSRAALALSLMLLAATIVIGSLYFGYRERQHSTELGAENIRVRKAEKEAREAEKGARDALEKVETARLGSRSHLFWSNYQLGSALRTTGTPGHRSESIKALQAAYRVLPELGLSEKARKRRELAVRAHAFSALANWELSTEKTYPSRKGWTPAIATDFVRNRYSRVSETGKIEVCDSETSDVIKTFQATNEQRAWLMRFSPQGTHLASKHHPAFKNNQVHVFLWDIETGEKLLELNERLGSVHFRFSADNSKLVVSEKSGFAVYATTDGALIKRVELGFEPQHIRFANQDKELIYIAEPQNKIQFLSYDDEQVIREVESSFDVVVYEWNDQHQQLVVAGERLLAIWPRGDLTAEPHEIIAHASSIRILALRPQADLLITFGWDRTTRVFDMSTHEQVMQITKTYPAFAKFSDDGRLAFSSRYGECGIWKFSNFGAVTMLRKPPIEFAQHTDFHPRDSNIIGCLGPGRIEIWNHQRNQQVGEIEYETPHDWTFDTKGEYLYACGPNGVHRWSLMFDEQGQLQADGPQQLSNEPARHLQIDEQNQLMIVRSGGKATVLTLQGEEVTSIGPHDRITNVRVSPCRRYVVSATWKGNGIKVWDAASGDLIKDLVPEWRTANIEFSPDGKTLAAVCETKRWTWDVETWKPIVKRDRDELDGSIGGLAWSQDCRMVASKYNLNQPQLFLPETGETVVAFEAPVPLLVGQMEFSEDDRYLSVSGATGIHIWDIHTARKKLGELGMNW